MVPQPASKLGADENGDGTNIDAGSVDKPLVTDYDGDGYLDMLLGNQAGNIMLYTQSARNAVTSEQWAT